MSIIIWDPELLVEKHIFLPRIYLYIFVLLKWNDFKMTVIKVCLCLYELRIMYANRRLGNYQEKLTSIVIRQNVKVTVIVKVTANLSAGDKSSVVIYEFFNSGPHY